MTLRSYKISVILVVIIGVILFATPVLAQALGAFSDAKLIGQISGDNLVIQQNINNGELIIRGGVDNSGGSVMDASFIIMFAAVAIMACGFVFRKSWLLWLAIPFFILFSLYWAYLETWFPANAQHSLILIGVGATFGLAYSAIRMQAKPTTARSELDEDMDEEDTEYQMQQALYAKQKALYSSKKKKS